jgi:hypothetical protein
LTDPLREKLTMVLAKVTDPVVKEEAVPDEEGRLEEEETGPLPSIESDYPEAPLELTNPTLW